MDDVDPLIAGSQHARRLIHWQRDQPLTFGAEKCGISLHVIRERQHIDARLHIP